MDSFLYAINESDGTEKWKIQTGGRIYSSPKIGPDGTIYVGSNDNKMYAIRGSAGSASLAPWPMKGQNSLHTGKARTSDLSSLKHQLRFQSPMAS